MNVVLFGATGGTGRAVIQAARERGTSVTAFVRNPSALDVRPGLEIIVGDVMEAKHVAPAITASDMVIVSLGNSQNPIKRAFGEKRTTSPDVCEVGTRNVLNAMKAVGARRLIVVSAFGVGNTREKASWLLKLFYRVLLREQMADKERQESLVKASGLDWTIIQPVALTDKLRTKRWIASQTGQVGSQEISRGVVASFVLDELDSMTFSKSVVALSEEKK